MKFAVYSRKSVCTSQGESIENQVEMCRQYIHAKFADVRDEDISVFEDEGFSGKNTDRPEFSRLMREIRNKQFDFVVCYRLDRISRNVSDFSGLIEELGRCGIAFICIREEFDTSRPMGKAMMYVASVFAQLERETIAERVRDNMRMLSRSGRWLGGTTPTGFVAQTKQVILPDGRAKDLCVLADNPAETAIIQEIFCKFLETRSLSAVCGHLRRQGRLSRLGRPYSAQGIKQILQNPVYCAADLDALRFFCDNHADVCFSEGDCDGLRGLVSYNKRDYSAPRAVRQSIEKWIVSVGAHSAVITGAQWVEAQRIIAANRPHGTTVHNAYALLSGLVYCKACGGRMFAKTRSKNPQAFDYICHSKMRFGKRVCGAVNLVGKATDEVTWKYLMQFINEGPEIYKWLYREKKRLETIDARHVAASAYGKPRKDKQALENATGICEDDAGSLEIDQIATALCGVWENSHVLNVYEKRAFVGILLRKAVWDGENLEIYINSGKDEEMEKAAL